MAADGAGEVAGEGRAVGQSPRRGGPITTSTGDAAARPPDGAVLAPPLQPRTHAVRRPCGGTRRGSAPSAAAHACCRAAAAVLGRRASLRHGSGGEAMSGAGDDDAEAAAAQGGAMAMTTCDTATTTVEVSPLAACGRRRRRGSEGSATHPRRVLPPAEINLDLPGGRAGAAEAAARLGLGSRNLVV